MFFSIPNKSCDTSHSVLLPPSVSIYNYSQLLKDDFMFLSGRERVCVCVWVVCCVLYVSCMYVCMQYKYERVLPSPITHTTIFHLPGTTARVA